MFYSYNLSRVRRWLIAGVLATGLAQADVYEGFNYTVGETLDNKTGGTGWATDTNVGWRDGAGTAGGRTVDEGSLTYPGLTPTGQKAGFTGSRIFRNFATPLATGTHYVRVLVQRTNEEAAYFGLSLHDPATPATNEKILIGKSTGYQTWTINRIQTGNPDEGNNEHTTLDSGIPATGPSLLVVKLELVAPSEDNPEGLDQVTFWVNPDLSKPERVANAVGGRSYTTTLDYGAISRARIGGANTVNGAVDELLISSASVFPAGPEIVVEDPEGAEVGDDASADFGDVLVNQTKTLTYTVKNNGNADLADLAAVISGEDSPFTVEALSSSTVPPDGTVNISVTFNPTVAEESTDTLTITSNDPYIESITIALSGRGIAPELTVEQPPGTGFANGGTLRFNASGISQIITLKNTGTATLSDLAVDVSGDAAEDFEVSELTVSELAPDASTTVTVTFNTSGPDPRQALLIITSNDPTDTTFEVLLSGSAFGKVVGTPATESSLNAADMVWGESAVGMYDGLLYEESTLVGAIESFKIAKPKKNSTGGGAVTAKLRLDGRKISMRGIFDASGALDVTLTQKNADPIVISLQLQQTETDEAGEVVRGTVVQGDFTATADLARAPYSNKNKAPTDQTGRFTLLMPVNPERLDTEPGGDGYAAVNVSAAGIVKVAGVLGDGTKWTESGYLSADGTFCLFNDLYKTKPKGIAGGMLTFRDVPEVSDFDGLIQWVKRADAKEKIYPAGFSIEGWVIGSRFTPPAKGSYILSVLEENANASLSLLWGRIYGTPEEQGEVERTVTWNDKHKWIFNGAEKLSGNANKSTGVLAGSYRNPVDNKTLKLRGVVFQKQGLAGGQFALPGGTGLVRMEPEGPAD